MVGEIGIIVYVIGCGGCVLGRVLVAFFVACVFVFFACVYLCFLLCVFVCFRVRVLGSSGR